MPRLRHIKSGAVVSVSDEKAARLDAEWEPVDAPPAKKAPAKKAQSSRAASSQSEK